MEFYKETNTTDFHDQTFAFLLVEEVDHVLTITLNREKKRNALHPQMVNEITYAFQYAHSNKDIWMIVIGAKGNVFCAGADLKAFMGVLGEFTSSIPEPKGEILIGELFNKVHKPVIAKVEGDVVTLETLKQAGLLVNTIKFAKVVLSGEISRSVTVKGLRVTKGARAAIEAAGGKIEE